MSDMEFIEQIAPKCQEIYAKNNIFPSVSIGQAILESGYGKSELATKANNIFGIKALRDWNGEVYTVKTKEYTSPTTYKIIEQPFRKYEDWSKCIEDYSHFLEKEWYIQTGVFSAKTNIEQLESIFKAGYTSDYKYIQKIKDLILKYNLEKYDTKRSVVMNIIDTNLKFRNGLPNNNSPKNIVLHHTECNGWSVERLHNLHKNEFGWNGLGYHFYIRKDGSIYRGRPEWTMGSHCKGFNKNSIGIAFEGDYHNVDKSMPDAQFNAGLQVMAYLKNKYGNMGVYGHREVGSSNCPGRYFPLSNFKNGKTATTNTSSGSLDGKMAICTGNSVRVRSSADTSSTANVIGKLNKGDKVKIFKKCGDWYHTYYGEHGGYVSAQYLRVL